MSKAMPSASRVSAMPLATACDGAVALSQHVRIGDDEADAGVACRSRDRRRDCRSRACAPPSRGRPSRWRRPGRCRASRPPMLFGPAQRVEVVLHRQHRGRVDGVALEDRPRSACRPWPCGRPSASARRACWSRCAPTARGESTIMPCAASPPMHLLPGEGHDIELVPVERHARRRPRSHRRSSCPRGRRRSSRRSARARRRRCRSR